MSLRVEVGPRTPCPKLFRPITTHAGQGVAGPSSACLKRPMCANQQEEGVQSRCPTSPPPPNRQQKRGWGQRQYCFTHHAW